MQTSLARILMFCCSACSSISTPPTLDRETGRPLEIEVGSLLEVSSTMDVQEVILHVPSRLFVLQNSHQLLVVDVDEGGELPRKLSIPMRSLDDGSGLPKYLLLTPPRLEVQWLVPHCMKCEPDGLKVPCCPTPPLLVVP